MNGKIRILLADDHEMLREGLRELLQNQRGMEIVGEAKDGRTAIRLAALLAPDVVVMDVSMPDMNGIEATRQIREGKINGEGPIVVGLSGHSDSRFASEMMRAGARGYVLKESAFQELAEAVKSVVANKVYLSPGLAGTFIDGFVGHVDPATGKVLTLSAREREILQLVAEGKSTKEVAFHLKVSIKTIETHRRNLMEKLNIHSVAELTKYAIREGMTTVEG